MKRKSIRKERSKSVLHQLLDKKHRPAHGAAVGLILVMLRGVMEVLALVGVGLLILSAIAYLLRAAKSTK